MLKLFYIPENFSDNKNILRYVILLFLSWRVSLVVLTFLGLSVFPSYDFYNKQFYFSTQTENYWSGWGNWDSGAFLSIAQYGYDSHTTVFFPLYPMLIKFFSLSGLSYFCSAFFISQICTVIFMFYFFKLVLLDFNLPSAKRSIFAILIFPSAFYLGSIYGEALFMAVAVPAFYFARKGNWIIASVLAGLAGISRLAGLGVITAIMFEYLLVKQPKITFDFLRQNRLIKTITYLSLVIFMLYLFQAFSITGGDFFVSGILASLISLTGWVLIIAIIFPILNVARYFLGHLEIKRIFSFNFLSLALSILPFLSYLIYQKTMFGSYFTFINSESWWGRGLSSPWNGPIYAFKYVFLSFPNVSELSAHMYIRVMIFLLACACLIIGSFKLRFSYVVFSAIALFLPLFSGTLADFARYSLIVFPIFIVLGSLKNEFIQKAGVIISTLLLSLLTVLYFNGYFFI